MRKRQRLAARAETLGVEEGSTGGVWDHPRSIPWELRPRGGTTRWGLASTVASMTNASMLCPRCGTSMEERPLGYGRITVCPEGHGVFLDHADIGHLVEAETDWHSNATARTAPMPRITPDMLAPPTRAKRA